MLRITTCPTCGSKKIKQVRRSVSGVYRGQKYVATGVTYDLCPNCGEKLYGPAAMRKIEAARQAAVNGTRSRPKVSKGPVRQPA
jgi:YgiT-type zinc finger domain-containing protein